MGRVMVLTGCFMCWYNRWGVCVHEDNKRPICPASGFAEGCTLQTADEMYEAMKTYKYYADNDW